MTQNDIIKYLNSKYPFMDMLKPTEDIYASYDCENKNYIIEIKSRNKSYNPWIIEKKKFDSNIKKAKKLKKDFIYLTEYRTRILTWNINDLINNGYDFKWEKKWLPVSTIPMIGDVITGEELKSIGYLYEKYARRF